MKTQPIACTLSEDALKERQSTNIAQLLGQARDVQPLSSGYRFQFDVSDQLLKDAMELIIMERKCCQFIDFKLVVSAAEGPVWLSLEGPDGTKEFLESVLLP